MDKAHELRVLLRKKQLLLVSGVYDALNARIAHYCGFPAVYMTGYGTAAAYGYPDYGLMTMTEMLENLRRISYAVDVPLIADADTGYGNSLNVYRTVQEYERAGAAAIQLEDQTWPKRCGHMEGKMVIQAEDMVSKVKAAVDARVNPDTVLVIRTDAIATHGFEEAIRRSEMYAEAGADVIFVEAPGPEHIEKIPSRLSKPCLLNLAFPDADLDLKELERMGYAIALFPAVTLFGTIEGCMKKCNALIKEGKFEWSKDMPFNFSQLNALMGLQKFQELEQKYT